MGWNTQIFGQAELLLVCLHAAVLQAQTGTGAAGQQSQQHPWQQ
jgi:hypothetical protein